MFGQGFPEQPSLFLLGGPPTLAQELRNTFYAGEDGTHLAKGLKGSSRAVYYAPVVCCRSKKPATSAELEACFPLVYAQILATKPKAILCLGDTPTKTLLKTDQSASALRGRWHDFEGYCVRTTHSLSKIAEGNAQEKAEFEEDVESALRGP